MTRQQNLNNLIELYENAKKELSITLSRNLNPLTKYLLKDIINGKFSVKQLMVNRHGEVVIFIKENTWIIAFPESILIEFIKNTQEELKVILDSEITIFKTKDGMHEA